MRALKATLALALVGLGASASAQSLGRDAYRAHLASVEAHYEAERARCKPLEGNQQDMCEIRALGSRHVARAELEARHKPGPRSEEKLAIARAEAAHAFAKEKCDELKGNPREVCRKDASAALATAKADAKTAKEAGADPKLLALGRERCEAMTGISREMCLSDLKSRFPGAF